MGMVNRLAKIMIEILKRKPQFTRCIKCKKTVEVGEMRYNDFDIVFKLSCGHFAVIGEKYDYIDEECFERFYESE